MARALDSRSGRRCELVCVTSATTGSVTAGISGSWSRPSAKARLCRLLPAQRFGDINEGSDCRWSLSDSRS